MNKELICSSKPWLRICLLVNQKASIKDVMEGAGIQTVKSQKILAAHIELDQRDGRRGEFEMLSHRHIGRHPLGGHSSSCGTAEYSHLSSLFHCITVKCHCPVTLATKMNISTLNGILDVSRRIQILFITSRRQFE